MQGFNFYIVSRLVWNADTDWRATLEEYCEKFFGPAGRTMLQYYNRIRRASQEAVRGTGGGYSWLDGLKASNCNNEMETLLRRGLAEAATEQQRSRIGLILDTYHAHTMWREMTPLIKGEGNQKPTKDEFTKIKPLAERFVSFFETKQREPMFKKFSSSYGVYHWSNYVIYYLRNPGGHGWRP